MCEAGNWMMVAVVTPMLALLWAGCIAAIAFMVREAVREWKRRG